ncbi:PD-(D/E)XK nuclease family protein [Ornithinimicrobium faecis]|uniref:PD-(D/E)XK nuclease family protein n=1 Tax=Ornithinimicrobium faecis TaxID=2934158 RepID=UPI002118E03B|nr:PD-(D/E)XK nuclease family protein [Ornithinimicrobium sp. HY1745]
MTSQTDHDLRMEEMVRSWRAISGPEVDIPQWTDSLRQMQQEVRALKAQGRWRTGGRTLLNALMVHHDEVILCRGLAWLLTPDGWHGLGSSVLAGLLDALDLPTGGAGEAQVVIEEQREETRADIIIRYQEATVLIEAKVWAGEQYEQADRLARRWEDEDPTLVFLTRDRRLPITAVESRDSWRAVSWQDLTIIIRRAIDHCPDPSPGAIEYSQTLEHYGGAHG